MTKAHRFSTRASYIPYFTEYWRDEIHAQLESGDIKDGFSTIWLSCIDALLDEGDVPHRAKNWGPPRWLRRMDARYAKASA